MCCYVFNANYVRFNKLGLTFLLIFIYYDLYKIKFIGK